MTEQKTARRPDIQALRFVAVISVVLFHAELPFIRGGFIGVDIFFVISGFLIIGMLYEEFDRTQRIRVIDFWAKRMRRLMPAATLVICVTLLFSNLILGPFVAKGAAVDSMWASFYAANIRFALTESDYFSAIDKSPFLHFWSLGVEEQFYIALPLFLLFSARFFRIKKVLKFFILMLISTFVLSLTALFYYKSQLSPWEFYGPISRGWEFAIGGLAAVASRNREKQQAVVYEKSALPNALVGFSWAAVVLSCLLISFQDVNANLKTIVPVLGTATLLYLNPKIRQSSWFEKKFLSIKAVQKLGDYSYGLYLWHWPVLILGFSYLKIDKDAISFFNYLQIFVLILISIALSFVTWKYVEEPVRRNKTLISKSGLSLILGLALSVSSFSVAFVLTQNNFIKLSNTPAVAISNPQEEKALNSEDINKVIETLSPKLLPGDESSQSAIDFVQRSQSVKNVSEDDFCFAWRFKKVDPLDACVYGSKTGERWVLFGDSFANMWLPGLMPAGDSDSRGLELQTRGVCTPALFQIYDSKKQGRNTECEVWREGVIKRLVDDPPEVIIVGSSWISKYAVARDDGTVESDEKVAMAAREEGLRSLLSKLPNESLVIFIRATPRMAFDVPECLSARFPKACQMATTDALDSTNLDIRIAAEYPHVKLLDLTEALCSQTICYSVRGGSMIYRDTGHVTAEYSAKLQAMFQEIINVLKLSSKS